MHVNILKLEERMPYHRLAHSAYEQAIGQCVKDSIAELRS